MSLADVFAGTRAAGELAFVPYQTAGFPTLRQSLANVHALTRLGADLVEIGLPFSDPIADGPTIQHASNVALENGITPQAALDALVARPPEVPGVVMSYLNPLLAMPRDRMFGQLRDANVRGLIVPDLPPELGEEWERAGERCGVDLVYLLAPNSSPERVRLVAARSRGFIYAVAVVGTTGARAELYEGLPPLLEQIRGVTDVPVVVGFGISHPDHVRALHGLADGVVVASRLIEAMRRGEDWQQLARDLKAATRRERCS